METKFNKIIEKHNALLKKNNTRFNIVGFIKLMLIVLLGMSLYFTFAKGFTKIHICLSALDFIVLIVFWIYHNRLHKKIDYSNAIIAIDKRHLDRISGNWSTFSDIGEEFIDTEHPYACDLDIVGRKSLFQFLNTTHTWYGRKFFADSLLKPRCTNDELSKRQEAISELSKDIQLSNHMEYHFSQIGGDSSAEYLVKELKDKKQIIKSKALKTILINAPILTLSLIAAIFIFKLSNLYWGGLATLIIQTIVWVIGMPRTHEYLKAISHLPYKLSAYSDIIDELKDKKFASEKLNQIQSQLITSNHSAAHAIKELSEISDKVSVKNNGIIYFLFNVLFLWDYNCAISYEEWKEKYAHVSESWFLALGEFESLLCFSNLLNICDHTCKPTVTSSSKTYEANQLGHPLIPNHVRVTNNASATNSVLVISGSNMSGKTTFLRTVGINLVLARAGSFVCAKQMTCSSMEIMTSMRISDDLNEGISTFYAELKRIKGVIELAKKEQNMIFLIDEIFRGTNSIDRLTGAKTVLSKLYELGVIGLITTHDLELCGLVNQYSKIRNFSFSESYKDNQINFDYKIRNGKSNTTNAKYLMKMVGII